LATKEQILTIIEHQYLIIDGAMGTQIQDLKIPSLAWLDENGISQEGCNELLNDTAGDLIRRFTNDTPWLEQILSLQILLEQCVGYLMSMVWEIELMN